LFVHNRLTTFVRLDRDLLRARYPVTEAALTKRPGAVLRACRAVAGCDLVFGWFASWHTLGPLLAARRLGKRSLLVVGGYDLACLPEIGYGQQRGGLRRLVSRAALRAADGLVTNAEFSRREAEQNAGVPPGRVRVIYHGLPDPLGALPAAPRRRQALTVGDVNRGNLTRKGLAPFVEAARALPDVEFVVIGGWQDDAIGALRRAAPANVVFTGRLSDAALWACYQEAAVYVQASRHEGFGLSVAEAMLAGCLPVVTRAGALPEVVGDCGVYAAAPTGPAVAAAIRTVLACPPCAPQAARDRILTQFCLEKRRAALYAEIDALLERKD
jgi:glycosyltransferase involved in cell wall biosynthesis